MTKLLALWSGDLALTEAFWTWTVTVGLLINVATSILFSFGADPAGSAAGRVGHRVMVFSVPYNIVATVGGLAVGRALRRSVAPRRSLRAFLSVHL